MLSKKPKLDMFVPPSTDDKMKSMPTEAPLAMVLPPLIALLSVEPVSMGEEGLALPM